MQQLSRQRFPFFLIFLVCLATLIQWFLKESHLLVVRTIFAVCHLISFTGIIYVHLKVASLSKLEPPKGKVWPKSVPVLGGEPIRKQDYDLEQSNATLYSSIFSFLMVCLIHWYNAALTPLVLSSCIGIKNMHDKPLFKIHVMGHSDQLYPRPFGGKVAPPSMSMMFTDPEKYYEITSAPTKRIKKKKLSGKEKRAQRQMEKARAGKL
jgi:hypothetical protein